MAGSWHFTPAERAEDANDVGDDIRDPLHAGWDAGRLLELTAVIATFVNLGRMFDTLRASDPALFTRPVV